MKTGIDFIINGKDMASSAMKSVEKSLTRLQAAFVAYQGVVLSRASLDKVNQAFDEQTASVKKLTNALAIRGASGESQHLQSVAKEMEKLTGINDQTTLGLMHQAQSMGFATDRMDDAAKAALGLAEATGNSAEQSLSDLKAALEGNFDAFVQLNPQILYMRTNQEKMAAVLKIAQLGLDQASNNMTTVAGSGLRANTAISTLMETIGTLIAPIRVLINAGLQQLSETLANMLAPAAEYARQVLENIGPWMDWLKEKIVAAINVIVGAFTFFETILTNLSSVWDMAVAYAEMSMIAFKENVMHVLTVAIPEYAKWFGRNFVNLIKDAFSAVITVIDNAGKIIGDMVYQIFEFIASGGEGGVSGLMRGLGESASRSLLDGFESSLTSLPEIAERQLTQRENDLADKIGKIGGRLGQEFSDKMSERMFGVGSELGSELQAATKNIDLKGRAAVIMQGSQATEGRLLTRGPGSYLPNKLDQIIQLLRDPPEPKHEKKRNADMRNDTKEAFDRLKQQKAQELRVEFVK